ncbi:hypothetical protein JCM17846_15080 [Iodidimonas nitroreducens]|uniref:Uncharacterized protein n=1 Tax=Iodidimonas nitroreducens TaxID=1236968 RepID=A0A5A7NA26_9PROT|nr:hypothetical protein JCM17846_15080 [Iodidimonas nitroreducens]
MQHHKIGEIPPQKRMTGAEIGRRPMDLGQVAIHLYIQIRGGRSGAVGGFLSGPQADDQNTKQGHRAAQKIADAQMFFKE